MLKEQSDELEDAEEDAEQGEAQSDVNHEETGLPDIVVWIFWVTDGVAHYYSQKSEVKDGEKYDGRGQYYSVRHFFPEGGAVDPVSDQFVGVPISLMTNLTAESLGTQDLFALDRVFCFF